MTTTMQEETVRHSVREHYARVAKASKVAGGCGCGPSCGSPTEENAAESPSLQMGYTKAEIEVLPEGADLGLGCGNPGAIAALREGETVLDLGAGAGIDCLLAVGVVKDGSGTGGGLRRRVIRGGRCQ